MTTVLTKFGLGQCGQAVIYSYFQLVKYCALRAIVTPIFIAHNKFDNAEKKAKFFVLEKI